MKKSIGVTIGFLLIVCGALYILGAFGVVDVSFSLNGWWTLFIIIPCFNGIFESKDKIGNIVGLLLGILLLLAAQDVFEYDMVWKIFAPAIVVAIGAKMIMKSSRDTKKNESTAAQSDTAHMSACGAKIFDYGEEEFSSAKVGAVFGGAKCNLTNSKIKNGSRLDVMCIFGGAEIVVPENVKIVCNTFCLFGGINDKRSAKSAECESVTLNINGFCIFGGVEIK